MVRIRLTRTGRKNVVKFRIAVFEGTTARDGAYLEKLGTYDPAQKEAKTKVTLNRERFDYWLSRGARPTYRLAKILRHAGATGQ